MKRRDVHRFILRTLGAAAALPGLTRLASAAGPERTPSQTEGPYYPVDKPTDRDWNLLRAGTEGMLPVGTPLELSGRVLDADGAAIPDAVVEIWQADSQGIYDHPRAPGRSGFDRAFQGFGAAVSDADGYYRFLTLVPAPYTGRPPHIHAKIWADGRERLTTQLYIKDHPENRRDGILMRLFSGNRDDLMMVFEDAMLAVADGGVPLPGKRTRFDFVI